MLKLIATNGPISLWQTGFTTLYPDFEALQETLPSGHIVDDEGKVIEVPNIESVLRSSNWTVVAPPDEPVGKGRKRQFASRAEAARYAAQIRWGNRTPDANSPSSLPTNPLPIAATNDINEAIMTGAPYAPFLPENFPPDLKAALDEIAVTERAGLMGNSSLRAHAMLEKYYMTHMDPALYSPETIAEMKRGYYREMVDTGWVGDQRRAGAANLMADMTLKRVHERIYVTDKIGDQEALDYTKGMVASPKASIAVAVHRENLMGILDKGLSTQFETQESGGTYAPSYRAAYEAATFGTHPLTVANRRPIYANLHPVGVQSVFTNRSEQYGQIQLVVKKSVHDRATFSVQDSLGSSRTPASVKGPIKVGQASPNAAKSFTRQSEHPADKPEKAAKGERYSYAEAQIHQGLSVSDIAYVTMPKGYKLPAGAAAKLKELGIPVKRTVGNEIIEDSAIAKSVDIHDTIGRIWEAVDSLVVEKGRKRKFSTRTEAAQYAARIRWGTTSGESTTEKPHMKAMREEAEALRSEMFLLNQSVSFENMQRSSPASIKNPKAKGAWTDEKGDIQINTANEEMIPSPKVADLNDRVIALGDKMNIEAVARVKQRIADGTLDKTDREKVHDAYAKEMQNVVAELRPCGGVIEFNRDTPFTMVTSPVAFQDTIPAFSAVGKIMPTDWINATKDKGLQINSHVGVTNGSFSIPPTGSKPIINIPTLGTIQGRGEGTNLRVVGHETQHFVTHYRPSIAALEVAFMTHRTTGFDISGKNSSLTSRVRSTKRDARGLASTQGKKETIEIDSDAFSNLYSGRRYDKATRKTGLFRDVENNSRYPAFELMTTGFEQVLSGNRDNFDNDYMGFVLGVMATA
jgi:hypothetical protein